MLRKMLLAFAVVFLGTGSAFAWHIEGYVRCAENGLPLGGVVVNVTGTTTASNTPFSGTSTTDGDGFYYVALVDEPGSFSATLDLSAIGGGTVVSPAQPYNFVTTDTSYILSQDWLVSSPACGGLACWLTGGGAKFSTVTASYLAEKGPQVSFGGNVYPGCDPDSGQGGQWNHVDHASKLHFQGWTIHVDRCGNVDGIPTGSTSPATPFNYIDFSGTGTLKAIAGGKYNGPTDVCFTAHAEDRNEPGSSGTRDGAKKDRYFIRVFACDAPATTLLFLEDATLPGDTDPVTITDGNLQIHVSSCP